MRVLLAIFAFSHSCFTFCQTKTLVEIKDFRPDRDSVNITKELPQGIELTSKYICRNFDFCTPIKDKLWLTSHQPNEKSVLSARNDLSQLVIERDSNGRVISQVYYTCIGCLPESYGYTFSYDSSGNEVTTVQLTTEDIILLRHGLRPNEEKIKRRLTTSMTFSDKGSIRYLTSSFGGDSLFSIKVLK
jgi:hypothetical protein